MRFLYAILADGAQSMPDGKFNVFGGGIETLLAPAFPALTPSLTLLVRLAVASEELERQHTFRIELHNPAGQNVLPTEADKEFTTHRGPALVTDDADFPVTHLFVVNFPNLVFAQDGKHVFRIFVDNTEVGSLPIYLLRPQITEHTTSIQEA